MNIKLPDNFKKIITFPDYIESSLSSYWRKNKKDVHDWLGPVLKSQKLLYYELEKTNSRVFSTNLDNPKRGEGKFKSQLRFNLGYGALLSFSDTQLGFKLYSQKAFDFLKEERTDNEITGDHFFGTTPTGASLFKKYRDVDWNLDYILNDYIPNGLYKFLRVNILDVGEHTKGQNGNSGIVRGDKLFNMEEKEKGLHYSTAGIALPLLVTTSNDEELV